MAVNPEVKKASASLTKHAQFSIWIMGGTLMALTIAAGVVLIHASLHSTCNHGTSSVGPVTKVNGKIVHADTVPHMEGCR